MKLGHIAVHSTKTFFRSNSAEGFADSMSVIVLGYNVIAVLYRNLFLLDKAAKFWKHCGVC